MKGIILAGGSGSRLYPMTTSLSKHLLPVYDKPMVYYSLSTLMLAGIRDILIISTPQHLPLYKQLLKEGQQWGIQIQYALQPNPGGIAEAFLVGEDFIESQPVCLMLGDNIFHGHGLGEKLQHLVKTNQGATVLAHYVSNPSDYGVVSFDAHNNPIDIVEKPKNPQSHYAVSGLYFYNEDVVDIASSLTPSTRGELEITDINKHYLEQGQLTVELFHRGVAWLDMGTPGSLLEAANFIHTLEVRQGLKIGCPEEVAWHMGYIDDDGLKKLAAPLRASGYGDYLLKLLEMRQESSGKTTRMAG